MKKLLTLALLLTATQLPAFAKPHQNLLGKHPGASLIQVSPNGKWLVTSSGPAENTGTARLWNLRAQGKHFKISDKTGLLDWLPDSRLVQSGGNEKDQDALGPIATNDVPPVLTIVNPNTRKTLVLRSPFSRGDRLLSFAASLDGKKIVVLSRDTIRHYDGRTGKLVKRIDWAYNRESRPDDGWRGTAELSPDGRNILTLGNQPRLYDAANGKLLRSYPKHIGFKWMTDSIFVLGREKKPHVDFFSEFYDLRKPNRLWVVRGGVSHESVSTPQRHILFPGLNWWVWRSATTGTVLRQMKSPIQEDDVYALTPDERAIYVLKPNGNIWKQTLPSGKR